MCSALTLGLTQNSNESLHSVLWHNAPKTKRVGQKSLKICASLAVSTFNEGSTTLAVVLADLGVQSPRTTLVHFVKRDKERNRCRIQPITYQDLLLPIGQTRKEHSSQTVSESDSGIALETAEDVSIPNAPDLYVVFFSLFLLDASAATNWAFKWCLRLL